MEKNVIITWLLTGLIIVVVGYFVFHSIIYTALGYKYTESKWLDLERQYCAGFGLQAYEYVYNACSLFGCWDIEKTKCVGTDREKLIDYDNKMFCELTMAGDYGLC